MFASLNQIPGVNFTNSDPFGTSGGNLRIRGFDGSRISVTFDGIPLNDSGNYALFTNQMLDAELIDRVDVNLGTTDVDSPTASATGGTVAYRTRRPDEEFGGFAIVSGGEFDYMRGLVRLDTGEFGPWGTKAFIAASYQNYDKFKGPGELEKTQFNAMVRQDFENENFVSVGFHYNENRNAFYRNASAANFARNGRDYENLDDLHARLPDQRRDRQREFPAAHGYAAAAATGATVRGQPVVYGQLHELLRYPHQPIEHGQRAHAVAVAPG